MTKKELINLANNLELKTTSSILPLMNCKAQIIYGDVAVVLKSYDTNVAIYLPNNRTLYVFERYSKTTQKHISTFIDVLTNGDNIFVHYLYRRKDNIAIERYSFVKKRKIIAKYINKYDRKIDPCVIRYSIALKNDFKDVI